MDRLGTNGVGRLRAELIAGAPAALVPEWAALAASAATANIFHEPWAVAAMALLPEAEGLRLLVVRDDTGRLIGLLPVQRRRVWRLTAALQTWEQRVRALGEPLVLPDCESAFWEAALALLDRARGVGAYLRLTGLIADSPATIALLDLLAGQGRGAVETRRVERAVLRGGTSATAHRAAHIRGKVLKEHRRQRARLSERGALTSDVLDYAADPARWIDDLFALELTGWKGRDGVAAAADPLAERCFRTLLTEAHARGRLDFRRLALDGRAIAMLATVIAPGDQGFQLKIAHDEAFAASSPGVLLEMDFLDHALDVAGFAAVDSCARAGHPMIDRIWPDRLAIVSLAVAYDRPLSRALVSVLRRRTRS